MAIISKLMPMHIEGHRSQHTGWLRAAVLGANDGVISTASLVVGVAASHADAKTVLIAGVAGMAAGAMSRAAGEYVSFSSQADTEQADLGREKIELTTNPEGELRELAGIYQQRGLGADLSMQVAEQLTKFDALGAHARDELGITEALAARPVQAAVASGITFIVGASVPIAAAIIAPHQYTTVAVVISTLCTLSILGALAAIVGGAKRLVGTLRVMFWGALAMAVTFGIGMIFRVNV